MAGHRTDLGDRIRAARGELGWKQKHLAAEVRVEPITVSRWERGATTPDLQTLRLVAGATGKPLAYFVSGDASLPAGSGASEAIGRMEDALERIEAELARLSDAVDALGGRRGVRTDSE
jgi:transcriptional regulator with XRE-family HTH domain